jgi:transposase
MSEITTIGLDLAKHVLQVHGVDAEGTTVVRKRLRRGQVLAFFSRIPRCVVGLEACATAHYWARELGRQWRWLHAETRLRRLAGVRPKQVQAIRSAFFACQRTALPNESSFVIAADPASKCRNRDGTHKGAGAAGWHRSPCPACS